MNVGVKIKGMERLRSKVNALPKVLNEALNSATYEITELVRASAELRLSSSMKFSSGELLGSLKSEVVIDSDGMLVGRVWSDKAQAIYREFGTGPVGENSPKDLPEDIHPVYTQTRWFIPASEVGMDLTEAYGIPKITIEGKEFYISRGQPSRPFLYPALKEILPQAPEIYKEHVQEKLRELK